MVLYMDMKRLPNMYSFWAKSDKLFYCFVIVGLFTKLRFFTLTPKRRMVFSSFD